MEVEVDEKELTAAGAELFSDGRHGVRIHGWEIETRKRSILNSSTHKLELWEKKLETCHMPEMIFGDSCLVLKHVESGTTIHFNAFDALVGWKKEALPLVAVPAAAKWKFRCKPSELAILDDDYTFTTPYGGSETITLDEDNHEGGEVSKETCILHWEDCKEKFDVVALAYKEPILFYDEVVLYEDGLADNGVSLLTVKVKVMPSGWFVLLRFWLRVDGVLMRLRDTRMHCPFENNVYPTILRESCWREATFKALAAKGYPTEAAAYNDPSIISQRLPVVMKKTQKLKNEIQPQTDEGCKVIFCHKQTRKRLSDGARKKIVRDFNITDLPDEIFSNILSCLSVKDAARVCLSRKAWLECWTFSKNLCFSSDMSGYSSLDDETKENMRNGYTRLVSDAISKCRLREIVKFHICFDLDSSHKSNIDDWLQFADQHKVRNLVLELIRPFNPSIVNYSFPKITGESLQVLVLENVDLDGEMFQCVSRFKGLEQLSVKRANGLTHISMCGSLVCLKSLVVRCCYNLEKIEICDLPRLAFFEFEGRSVCLDLQRVPKLVKVSLLGSDPEFFGFYFKQLVPCLAQIRKLKIENSLSCLISEDENAVFCVPQFPKLERLKLLISADDKSVLLQLASFLDACPRMRKLLLKVRFLEMGTKLLHAQGRVHNSLKKVKVNGFSDCQAAVDIIRFIQETAVKLESLQIDPVAIWGEKQLRF